VALRLVVHVHDLPVWSIPPAQVDRLRRVLPDAEIIDVRSHEECLSAIPGTDVLLATRMRAETLAAADALKWVHTTAVGVDWLPVSALAARHIPVTNCRGVHADTIAEHAIALILALRRQLHLALRRQDAREWAQVELSTIVVPPAAETRVLVVGLGAVGARVARLASALGMRVSGVRRHPDKDVPPGVERVHAPDTLRALLPETDILVLAAPNIGRGQPLMGPSEFALLKPSALLVNVSRGSLVDEPALAAAIREGKLAGAGLDAFAREPLDAQSPLWQLPSVIMTPHTAAFAGDYWTPAVDFFLANMERFRQGSPLENLVDPALGY
jgi:D-2-hydroxyacid dehydrogenase (NADP+)